MRIATSGLALALVGVAAGCQRDTTPVVLAAAAPWHLDYVINGRRGIEMAAAEINAAGGIAGRPLTIRWLDDSASGAGAVAAAESLIADPAVLGVVGHMNSNAMVAAARIYNGRLPVVSPWATTADLTGLSPWVFRNISSDSVNGVTIAQFARTVLGAKRAAVLYENDAYGRGVSGTFRQHFGGTSGGTIIASLPIDPEARSYEAYVTYLRGLSPDVVFVAGLSPSGLAILREARRQRMAAAFIGGDGWSGINADTAGSDGAYIAVPFTHSNARPEVRRFSEAYTARYHIAPEEDAALAYDAMRLLAAAVAAAPTRAGVRRYLAGLDATHAYAGVTGPHYFLPTGDPAGRAFLVARIRRGTLDVVR